jgi:hypothetical protein
LGIVARHEFLDCPNSVFVRVSPWPTTKQPT